MIFEFFVDDDILNKTNGIVDNSLEYYKCKFFINIKKWKDSFLFATFTDEVGHIETVPLGDASSVLTCVIPHQFSDSKTLLLYVFNEEKETNTIVIRTKEQRKVKKSKKCNIISDIFRHIDAKIDNIVYENCQLKCYSNGKIVDTIYLDNINVESSLYLKEDIANKTTIISSDSTDDEYPTAKATYEYIQEIIGDIQNDMLS